MLLAVRPRLTTSRSFLVRYFSTTSFRCKQPSAIYYDRVSNGEIRKDPRQEVVLKKLDQLYNQLQNYDREKVERIIQEKTAPRPVETDSLSWFGSKPTKVASTSHAITPHPAEFPQSIYLYGKMDPILSHY
jgi:predicted ATPase